MELLLLPGPGGTGGERRMPAVNDVGEPCAGEPHARFDVAGAGNGADPTRHLRSLGRCAGKRHHKGPVRDHLAGQPATAPALDPT